jgi:hypothetical protein
MAFLCQRTRLTARSGGPAAHPLFFVDETPDGPQHMGNRDVDTAFPENLRNPMNAYQSPFTNHFSAFHVTFTFHVSRIHPLAPFTNHFSPLTAARAVYRCASRISSLYCLQVLRVWRLVLPALQATARQAILITESRRAGQTVDLTCIRAHTQR